MAEEKNPAAVALAKKRAEWLIPERRKEIAEKAAGTHWGSSKKNPSKEQE